MEHTEADRRGKYDDPYRPSKALTRCELGHLVADDGSCMEVSKQRS